MYVLLSLFIALALARAPLKTGDHPEVISGSYVVLFNPTTTEEQQNVHRAMFGQNVQFKYNMTKNFMGYSAALTDDELETVLNDPIVKEVHHDHAVHIFGQQQQCDSTQTGCRAWGICRTSKWGRIEGDPLTTYHWDQGQGAPGVEVYVIDTGVRTTHTEFDGRAVFGANFVDNIQGDDNGHGTHCAGTIGGNTVGIARDCRIVGVRVLNTFGSGTLAGVIAGCNYAVNSANERNVHSVASMSLGGGYSDPLNQAVAAMCDGGVPTAVAAGNDNNDACNYSPASEEKAITVGATTTDGNGNDVRSSFSNWGDCVDCFAPGSNIYSCGIANDNSYTTLSGTSMACPHVAGIIALIRHRNPNLAVDRILDELLNNWANHDMVLDHWSKNNALTYSNC